MWRTDSGPSAAHVLLPGAGVLPVGPRGARRPRLCPGNGKDSRLSGPGCSEALRGEASMAERSHARENRAPTTALAAGGTPGHQGRLFERPGKAGSRLKPACHSSGPRRDLRTQGLLENKPGCEPPHRRAVVTAATELPRWAGRHAGVSDLPALQGVRPGGSPPRSCCVQDSIPMVKASPSPRDMRPGHRRVGARCWGESGCASRDGGGPQVWGGDEGTGWGDGRQEPCPSRGDQRRGCTTQIRASRSCGPNGFRGTGAVC